MTTARDSQVHGTELPGSELPGSELRGLGARGPGPDLSGPDTGASNLNGQETLGAKSTDQTVGYDAERLVLKHQASVWRYLRALGCSPAEADDLTQDTFLAVFQGAFTEINSAATAAYLRRVAYNLLVSQQRRNGRLRMVGDIEQFDEAWEQWAGNDQGETTLGYLRECLAKLSDRARQALELRFRDRSSRAEIADAIAMSEHGAKNLMQRAKKQLRLCIEAKQRRAAPQRAAPDERSQTRTPR